MLIGGTDAISGSTRSHFCNRWEASRLGQGGIGQAGALAADLLHCSVGKVLSFNSFKPSSMSLSQLGGVSGGQTAGATSWFSRFFLQYFKPLQKTYGFALGLPICRFREDCHDECGLIGSGFHERTVSIPSASWPRSARSQAKPLC
jgi:hypothetical protein